MEEKGIDKAAAFDTLFTTNRIRILKTLAYYVDPQLLRGLAVYIRYLELQYALFLFRRHPETIFAGAAPFSADALCRDLMPLCDPSQQKSLQGFCNTMEQITHLQEMMETLQVMQELFPDSATDLSSMDFSTLSDLFQGDPQSIFSGGFHEHKQSGTSDTPLDAG